MIEPLRGMFWRGGVAKLMLEVSVESDIAIMPVWDAPPLEE